MYALIHDDFNPANRKKLVLSVHRTRKAAEKALEKHQRRLKRRVWECVHRIVWVNRPVKAGDFITPDSFATWGPGEEDPYRELYSDTD